MDSWLFISSSSIIAHDYSFGCSDGSVWTLGALLGSARFRSTCPSCLCFALLGHHFTVTMKCPKLTLYVQPQLPQP